MHHHNGSVVVISSVPHIQRANHYHKEDYHYCYIISGSIVYYERPVGSTDMPRRSIYKAREMFYTPPMVEHCMYFEEPTTFVTLGGHTRRQEDYEEDLVRIASLHEMYVRDSTTK
jgi:dTDP-4-dehydrorhamnose 3,5-epimerase-like enzyme